MEGDGMKVSFTVLGPPKGKQRPKLTTAGGFARAYTPKDTVMYENLVRYAYQEQVGKKLEPPIRAEIIGVFPIPKSTPKKRRERMAAGELHTKKIDCDNLAKIILDSINQIAYDDDAGIAELSVRKIYGEEPRVDVTLEEIREDKE
jgi:Holliday junction resolvase RusA-like endonuclease